MREIGDSEQSPAAEIDPWPTAGRHPSWLGEPTPGYQAPGERLAAVGTSFAAPLLITVGFLAAAF